MAIAAHPPPLHLQQPYEFQRGNGIDIIARREQEALLVCQEATLCDLENKLQAASSMLLSLGECCVALHDGHTNMKEYLVAEDFRQRRTHSESRRRLDEGGVCDDQLQCGLQVVLALPELAGALGPLLGVDAVVHFRAASSASREQMTAVIQNLRESTVLEVYAQGSSRTDVERLTISSPLAPVSASQNGFQPCWQWQAMPRKPTLRGDYATLVSDGALYVFGGLARGPALAAAERLDLNSGQWQSLPSMPTGRYSCTAVSHRGLIYILGGLGCGKPLDTVEAYSPAGGRWTLLPPMPQASANSAAVVVKRALYVLGGYTGHGLKYHSLSSVQRLQLDVERWDPVGAVRNMLAERRCCAAVSIGDAIVVMGGLDSDGDPLSTVERHRLSDGIWERMVSMPVVHGPCLAVTFFGSILVLSTGTLVADGTSAAERYDQDENRWLPMPLVLGGCCGLRAAALALRQYL